MAIQVRKPPYGAYAPITGAFAGGPALAGYRGNLPVPPDPLHRSAARTSLRASFRPASSPSPRRRTSSNSGRLTNPGG